MRALNKAWIASGTGNLHKLVFDEETKQWVLPGHTAAAKRKRKAKRDQVSEQCEAIRNALASMNVQLRPPPWEHSFGDESRRCRRARAARRPVSSRGRFPRAAA